MSKLQEQINEEIKQAMRDKNELVLSVLRMLISAVKNKAIAMRAGDVVELTDEQVMEVVTSEIKKRRDSIEAFAAGNRQDLADKEKLEISILEKYLPVQLSAEEIEKVVKEIVDSGIIDFGKAMGQVMSRLKGRADGKQVGEAVKKILG